jgi:hypothetical protein
MAYPLQSNFLDSGLTVKTPVEHFLSIVLQLPLAYNTRLQTISCKNLRHHGLSHMLIIMLSTEVYIPSDFFVVRTETIP